VAALEVDVTGIDLAATLGGLDWLPRDPTLRCTPGRFERATLTPEGPGAVAVTWSGSTARVETDGPGGGWLAARAEDLLGCRDDVTGFDPQEQPLRDLWRRHRGRRIARTGTVWHDVAFLVVHGSAWSRRTVRRPTSCRVCGTRPSRPSWAGWVMPTSTGWASSAVAPSTWSPPRTRRGRSRPWPTA
jgi:hypothetical protein